MVTAEDVVSIHRRLLDNGIQVWLTGGWGIDALLGEQTRPHKGLDVIVLLDDVARLVEVLGQDGYDRLCFFAADPAYCHRNLAQCSFNSS